MITNIILFVINMCSIVSNSLQLHRLQPYRLLCPWNSPGKNTGVGSFSSPGDLTNPEIKPRSSALQADSLPSESPGKLVAKSLIVCLIKCFSFVLDK